MKNFEIKNINTPEYFDRFFSGKEVDKENVLRQEEYLRYVAKGDKVVELGCGLSYFPEMARLKGAESYGLDFSPKTIERLKYEFPLVNYSVGDATKTTFSSEHFNVTVAGEVIEHIENPEDLILEMGRITKPHGMIIISTPKLEFKDPEHLWEFDEVDLGNILMPYGMAHIFSKNSDLFPGRRYLFAICQKHS